MTHWRIIDTGVLSAAENMAWDEALQQAHAHRESVPILRFLQFSPPCVLVGRHQSPSQEARISYIESKGWDINRRITGGGAIFSDPSQIGWEVFASFRESWARCTPEKLYRRISEGLIAGLRELGIDARFRPRNDIEFDGRKIAGTGGASERNAFMFQGTLLVANVAEDMLRALRVPAEKLGRHGLESIRERVVFMDELLSPLPDTAQIKSAIIRGFAKAFDVDIVPSKPDEIERELFEKKLAVMSSEKWIHEIDHPEQAKGTLVGISRRKGTIRAAVQMDIAKKRISAVQFWGDFFIQPTRAIYDIEAMLKHRPAKPEKLRMVIDEFFDENSVHITGLNKSDFADALIDAVSKLPLLEQGFTFDEANRLFFANIDPAHWMNFPYSHFLFPYCSKLVGCKFRHRHDCPICGECTVGAGYELAQDAMLEPYTITSFQSLIRTHRKLRNDGFSGYIGSCCEEFFVKHMRSFKRSKLGIVLVKLDSTTCYDLSQQRAAYRGEFESQTELDMPLIQKVLSKL